MQIRTLIDLLRKKSMKIATAESCTGGLLAKYITDVPGSSDVFELGMVTYANRIKSEFLGVPEQVLSSVGAVSRETAEGMSSGVAKAGKADIGVGITGIAGPGGGTEQKPVGTVWISIYFMDKNRFITKMLSLSGDREQIREQTVESVVDIIVDELSAIS